MLQTMVVSYCLSVFCPFPISNELLNLKFFILLFLYMFYFPCSISYHWALIFPILIRKPLPSNSVIADGELPLIDVAVEASAADIQLEADRCDIVCADFVVLERALGNSVFHGSGLPGLHGPSVGAVIHHKAVHRVSSHCITGIDGITPYTQEQITLMISYISSYRRASLATEALMRFSLLCMERMS